MTLEETINAGHDPEVIEAFQEIRKALEENHPDLIERFTRIVERHEKMQRELYGARSKIDNLSRSLYGKRRR